MVNQWSENKWLLNAEIWLLQFFVCSVTRLEATISFEYYDSI